jgi:hypothetical protein
MSLRTWNTNYERKTLISKTIFLRQLIVQYNDSSSDDDDSSVSSSSSSSSSDDSMSSVRDAILPVADDLLQQAQKIYTPLEDTTIVFGQRKVISDFHDSQCNLNFRFRKTELQEVADKLWPRLEPFLEGTKEKLKLENRYTAPYETCLLLTLYRFHRPVRLRPEMEMFFGMRKSHISVCIAAFSAALYQLAIQYLEDPSIWHHRMPYYATQIFKKCGVLNNLWGFIDATIRKTCRPIRYQHLLYTKYIRGHGIKFQSIIIPDEYVAYLHGPFVARRHDARILRESGLFERLRTLMPADLSNGRVYSLYGDLAYPQSIWLFGGYLDPPRYSERAFFNRMMSTARIAVEWGFGQIIANWSFLDFKVSMKVFKEPIAQYYINAAFLCNLRNCYYGNQTSDYFEAKPLNLQEYLALID